MTPRTDTPRTDTPRTDPDILEQRFILPADATLVPLAELSSRDRARLDIIDDGEGQFAISRPGFRVPTRLVTPELAALLGEFRQPSRIVDAVLRFSGPRSRDPLETLDDAFDALAALVNSHVLVAEDSPTAEPIAATLAPGQQVAGYEVESLVSALEDTEVYRGRTADGKPIALKIARPDAPDAVADWLANEARVLLHLGGSSSPTLLEHGSFRARPFLAMEWRSGVPVSVAAQRARAAAAVDRGGLHRLCRNVLWGYAILHGRGVLHGDVHPGNIVIDDDDRVTILDFGRSQILTPATPGEAGGSTFVPAATEATRAGVAYFQEPELASAIRAGSMPPAPTLAGEQYSVAALLYYLISGVHYLDFSPEHDLLLAQVVGRPPLPFTARGLDPWPAVEAVLARALAKDPAKRFPGMSDLGDAFDRAGKARSPRSSRRGGPSAASRRLLTAFLLQAKGGSAGRYDAEEGPIQPDEALDLAWFAYRAALARDDFDLLASADVWARRARTRKPADWHLEAIDTEIQRSRGDPIAQGHALTAFASASERARNAVDLVGPWSGPLTAAARLLDGSAGDEIDVQPLARWARRTVDELWQTVDGWGPIADCPELQRLGMADGWAGLLHATLCACRSTAAPKPMGLAPRLDQLAELGGRSGRGVGWPRTIGPTGVAAPARSLTAGWSTGSAGHAFLWALAYEEYGDGRFLELAERAGWYGLDHPTANPDLGRGTTGQGFAMLRLYQLTGEARWLIEAQRLAGSAAARWTAQSQPSSLRTGALGSALLLVELEAPERAIFPILGG